MVYTVKNQHVYKSEILPKWMAKIFYSRCALFVYDLHVYKLWNTARWQEPAFDTASDLRVILLWSSCETPQHRAQGNINSLMVKYVQVWNRILSQNIYLMAWYWFMECLWWNAEFRIPIISTFREWSFMECYDWPLLCIEIFFDNLRCTSNDTKCVMSIGIV